MKVGLLTPSITFGPGVETPVVRLFAEQMARAVDLHVFALHYPVGSGPVHEGGFTLHRGQWLDDRFRRRMARAIGLIRREHEQAPFDVLHALWLHEPGTIAIAAGAFLRIPVVVSVGGAEVVALPDIEYGALRTTRGKLMTALVLQHATIVTAGSTYALRSAQRVVPHRDPLRFRRVPLPVDAAQYLPKSYQSFDGANPRLLQVASLIPVKDQAMLIGAFQRAAITIPGATLTIVGGDPFDHRPVLEQLRDSLGLADSVAIVGPRPHAAMAGLYRETDLFMLSSRHESQGMVVLEAAASGVPTVGTRVGVVPDLTPDAAITVPVGNAVALADATLELLGDPSRLARMGERARARVLEEYDAPIACAAFYRLYEDAIECERR